MSFSKPFVNKKVGGSCELIADTVGEDEFSSRSVSTGTTSGISNPGSSYATKESTTVTVDKDGSTVFLAGCIDYYTDRSGGNTSWAKILDGAVEVVSENSRVNARFGVDSVLVAGIVTDVSAGSHTYNLQGKLSASGSGLDALCGAILIVEVVNNG